MPKVMNLDSRGRYSRWGRYCYPLSWRDWEEQRRNIEKLYAQDGKTLKILRKQMSEDYGFKARYEFPCAMDRNVNIISQ